MTVRELIDQLNLLPDDLEVVISDPVNGEYYGGIDSTGVEMVRPYNDEGEYDAKPEQACVLNPTHELVAAHPKTRP